MGRNRLKKTRTARLRLTVTSRAEGKGRVDPAALQLCHRRGAPVSLAEPVTSGTLCAPPTRGDASSRRAPPPRWPGRARLAETAGAESAHWRPVGTQRELEAPAARLRLGGRPPSLSGRRAALFGGGEEGAVALASASRSSPAQAPAWSARARSPGRPPPLPRLRLSCWRARSRHHPVPEPLATSPRQPAPQARSGRNGSTSAAAPEALPRQPGGFKGCEPGSDFLAPVAAGWNAKAFEDLESPNLESR